MKKFLFISAICLFTFNSYARTTTLNTPYNLDTKRLNEDEKYKLQNLQYTGTGNTPVQYKGKLKYTEGKEEVHIKDARLYMGVGARYSLTNTIEMQAQEIPTSATYFDDKSKWDFDNNLNYFASAGLYWRNGFRMEFEYSKMTLDTNNFAENFPKMGNTIFNQYLQTSAYTLTIGADTYLLDNMANIVELSIETYMFNFIFEKSMITAKIRPYIGFGVGLVKGDMISLVTDKPSFVPGGQFMIGLSYPFSKGALVAYLGYRAIFAKEMEQEFTRITDADSLSDAGTYTNPVYVKSKENFTYRSNNLDLGIKFFF